MRGSPPAASGEDLQALNNPNFTAKVQDKGSLYLDSTDKALELSLGEKSQIQALDPSSGLADEEGADWTHEAKLHNAKLDKVSIPANNILIR